MIGAWENEPTGEIPRPMLAGLLEEPTYETTQVIPRPVLSELVEQCKPTPFVVTIRTPPKLPVTMPCEEFDDEEPALIVSLPPAANVARNTYTSRIATVLVSCVITCGCALVVGMLVL